MKKLISISLITILAACSVPERVVVTNVQDLTHYPPGSSVYALPRTRLAVTVTAVSYTRVPGPYCNYAEEFLGIAHVPMLTQTSWSIEGISIQDIIEPDPDYYYSVQSQNSAVCSQKFEDLQQKGFLMGPGSFKNLQHFNTSVPDTPEPLHYTDLTIKNLSEPLSNAKKKEKGKPVDMPVTRSKVLGDDEKAKAEEAANFILKIRKRRFKLLAGQYEVFPEGQALETSIRELNEMEEEYLSLFIGKTYTDTLSRTFFYTPGYNLELEREELCRFSEETGFQDARSTNGRALTLDIRNLKFTSSLKQVQLASNGPGHVGVLLYRIPDKAAIKILYGSITALEAEMSICQYGATVPLQISEE